MTGRPAPGPTVRPVRRPPGRGPRGRSWRPLLPLAVAVGVLLVVAGAVWSVWSSSAAGPVVPAAGPGEVALPGGLARVDQVVSAARPMGAMPGMGVDDDPVAEGERRVSVEVTLLATGDEPLRYAVDSFTLDVPGVGALTPHRSVLPGEEIPAGTQLSGTLVYDVPREATSGSLGYEGSGTTDVRLPPESEQGAVPEPGEMPGMPGMAEMPGTTEVGP